MKVHVNGDRDGVEKKDQAQTAGRLNGSINLNADGINKRKCQRTSTFKSSIWATKGETGAATTTTSIATNRTARVDKSSGNSNFNNYKNDDSDTDKLKRT